MTTSVQTYRLFQTDKANGHEPFDASVQYIDILSPYKALKMIKYRYPCNSQPAANLWLVHCSFEPMKFKNRL